MRHTHPHTASIAAAALFAMLFCGPASAQPDSGLPPILRDMPQSGAMCRNERLPGIAQSGGARAEGGMEASCALPVLGAQAFLQKAGAVVIDTRHEAEFTQFHIVNAMRIDAQSIRLKPYLRDRPLLLVGDGKSDRELYGVCGRLRAQGFKSVQVLMGGMAGYLAKELPVAGRSVPDAFEAAQLDPAQLWAQSQFPESLVLVVNGAPTAELLPLASQVADSTPRAIAAAVERRRKEHKTVLANVTVALDGAMSEATFRQFSQAVAPAPLLVYAGGATALKGFLRSQEAAWAAHARGPKQPRCG
ncbi:rhodanese-like domain-containing protein [Variovorax sp.]|jgi:rhodanese-related sulfurtransferase|uniref:rhodanese-like domain-containing protein n=1 Tax=Variovorax sp. TaxID=1871043 RepID=UPI0037DA081E